MAANNDTLNGTISSSSSLNGSIVSNNQINGSISGTQTGITSYDKLTDKPKINNVTLEKNKSFNELGATSLTNMQIENLINSIV